MGELDEAIRAHLELRRKHGASEDEVHAEEQEALGPIRREAGGASPAEVENLADGAGEPDLHPPPALHEPTSDEPAIAPPEEYPVEAPLEAFDEPVEPLTAPPPDPSLDTADLAEATELIDEPDPNGHAGVVEPEPHPSRSGDTPPRGFERVQDSEAQDAEPQGEEEDVLEETPDFLQETPEHDRLWFEQKPPRDFDFDE